MTEEKKKKFNWRIIKHLLVLVFWFTNSAVFVYYFYAQIVAFLKIEKSPISSISIVEESPFYYPTITACVWSIGDTDNPCPACRFEYMSCYWYNYADNTKNPVPCPLTFNKLSSTGGLQVCYEANADTTNLLVAKKKGYLGSINMIFRIPLNFSDPTLSHYRLGAVVNFREPGSALGYQATFTETNYAIPGRYNLFTIRKTSYLKLASSIDTSLTDTLSGPIPNPSVTYESTYSALQRMKPSSLSDNDFLEQIEVGFTFEELTTKKIEEVQQKDPWSVFGEISGMAGLLLGLDILKSFRIFLMFPRLFIKQTSLGKIWDAMN